MDAKQLILPIVSFCISLFYGWLVVLVILYKIIKNGRKFFEIKRTTEVPKEAFDPKYGNHNFITLKNQDPGYCYLITTQNPSSETRKMLIWNTHKKKFNQKYLADLLHVGIRLHYVESGNRDNPMMLMIHGFPDFWYSWRHQIPKFSEKYWIVAVDMRGYGDSDQPKHIKDYRVSNLVADMKELILTLGKDYAIVVAHDWGGVVAWRLAQKEPKIVKKLIILNAPHPQTMAKVLQRSWKQFLMSWYIFFFQLPYLPEFILTSNNLEYLRKIYKNCTKEEFEMYHFAFSQPGAFVPPINYYRANFSIALLPLEDDSASNHIQPATLIIWGDEDKALSTNLADQAAKYCNKADLVKISAGHWVHHERSDLVNKHIQDFMKI